MGNIISNLKKIFTNKNNLMILMVFVGIFVIYFGYDKMIDRKLTYVNVIYAKNHIESNTQITPDMLGTVRVSSDLLKKNPNIIKSVNQITDSDGLYYVKFDSNIPSGSLIYRDWVVSKEQKADSKYGAAPKGYRYVYFKVTLATTLGNAIAPGTSLDIYAYIRTRGTSMIFGKLYSNVEVVDVVDKNWNTTAGYKEKTPNLLILKVKEEDYRFLEKTKRIHDVELIPAPNNKNFAETEKITKISSYDIQNYIESQYLALTDE